MAIEPLILASASPRRRVLLEELGVPLVVEPCPLPEPEEKPRRLSVEVWAEGLAHFKACAVARRWPGRWVLGADTIVVCEGKLLGKPRDGDDARRMLELQAGRETDVITGLALVRWGHPVERIMRHCVTRVWMRDARAEREAYIAGGDWAGKAGAYGIQNVGDWLVERIDGSFSNVVGLPRGMVAGLLREVCAFPPTGFSEPGGDGAI